MYLTNLYRAYFYHQCEAHPALAHQDEVGERVFQVVGIEEALGDFRTGAKAKGFIFRLINYTYTIGDDGGHETQKQIQGGFIIARHFSGRNIGTPDYYAAMEQSEQVADEIIEKMIADSLNAHPLFYHSLDSRQQINVQPVAITGDANYAGWLCTFQFANFWRNCISDADAPAWSDGGLTPHDLLAEHTYWEAAEAANFWETA